MSNVRGLAQVVALWVTSCLLAACGGGGGGGGEDGGSGGGAFTLEATSASFAARQFSFTPPSQQIAITLTDNRAARLGAGFAGQAPAWLNVDITGSAPNFFLNLRVNSTDLPAGQHTATVLVGTADAAGNIQQSKSIAVSYNLIAALRVTAPSGGPARFVYGSSNTTGSAQVNVDATGMSWQITADAPWLSVPTGIQQGSQNLSLPIDASNLPPGISSALVTVQNTADATDRRTAQVLVDVIEPTISMSATSVVLGGTDGMGPFTGDLSFTLNTGSNAYPFTVSLSDSVSPTWLQSTATSGTVSAMAPATLTLRADLPSLQPAIYLVTTRVSVTVKDRVITTAVPVTLNWQSHRLFVPHNGIALSSFPSRSVLSRTLNVLSSRARSDIAWTAQSDRAWLTVTPSGVTGGSLQLTADPSALAVDTVNVATVTLETSDPSMSGETIRVGLWRSNTDPVNVDEPMDAMPLAVAVNPVEPYAYTVRPSAPIRVYNVYTGALVTQFSGVVSAGSAVTTSSDGRILFVTEAGSGVTSALDAATGSLITRYPVSNGSYSTQAGLLYTRPNAHAVLWTPHAQVIDVERGTLASLTQDGITYFPPGFQVRRAATADGSMLFDTSTVSTSSGVDGYTQRFTVLGQRALDVKRVSTSITGGGQSGWDMCVSASGTHLATLGPPALFSIAPTTLRKFLDLTIPESAHALAVACGWNGRIYVGLSANIPLPQYNVYAFDEAGNSAGAPFLSGPTNAYRTSAILKLSGDGTRIISPVSVSPSPLLTFYGVP